MALPSSGFMWMSQIADEFGWGGSPMWLSEFYRTPYGRTTANNTGVPQAGYISLAHFYGAQRSVAGSWQRTSAGTYSFIVPAYSTLTLDVRAGGGGGGGSNVDQLAGSRGSNGGNSHVYDGGANTFASGGLGGNGSNYPATNYYPNGTPAASNGAGGGDATYSAAEGGTGGAGATYGLTRGQNGGRGGRGVRTFLPGELTVGAALTVIVGAGGQGGLSGIGPARGDSGNPGAVYISWT